MNPTRTRKLEHERSLAISIGLSCWLWERGRVRQIVRLGDQLGVKLQLTEHVHGLRRKVRGQVTGTNVDRFICEFARLG